MSVNEHSSQSMRTGTLDVRQIFGPFLSLASTFRTAEMSAPYLWPVKHVVALHTLTKL